MIVNSGTRWLPEPETFGSKSGRVCRPRRKLAISRNPSVGSYKLNTSINVPHPTLWILWISPRQRLNAFDKSAAPWRLDPSHQPSLQCSMRTGEETGLTDEEIAFYDALAENENARQVMGEPTLRVIAHELVVSIKESVSVDWMHRETARARMRILVKRLLRKYGYPPDLQDAAVQNVLQQAEALSAEWAA